MKYDYDRSKKAANLKKHGLDFDDAQQVIERGQTVTFEDHRFEYDEPRFVTMGVLNGVVVVIVTTESDTEIRIISMRKAEKMSRKSTSATLNEDAPISQSDIKNGKLVLRKRDANGAILPGKQRVNIYLDIAIVEHFKSKAGERGYQTLINEALKQALMAESIETTIQKTIRAELRKY